MTLPLRFEGVMPANLLPFRADLSIDEPAYRAHLRWLAGVRGVSGLVVNGHAAEVSSLDREERRRALAIAVDEVRGGLPVVAGVYTDGTRQSASRGTPRSRAPRGSSCSRRRSSCGGRSTSRTW
jgi:4-hydroxy-tetrahydrodipicolinate synthase